MLPTKTKTSAGSAAGPNEVVRGASWGPGVLRHIPPLQLTATVRGAQSGKRQQPTTNSNQQQVQQQQQPTNNQQPTTNKQQAGAPAPSCFLPPPSWRSGGQPHAVVNSLRFVLLASVRPLAPGAACAGPQGGACGRQEATVHHMLGDWCFRFPVLSRAQ
jgi:hypothetical protein